MKVAVAATLFSLTTFTAIPGAAMGQINYVSCLRSVEASTNGGTDMNQWSDIGPWTASASSSHPTAGASASQTSDLRPDAIVFDLYASAGNMNAFPASSTSEIDITFSLTEATPYSLVSTGNLQSSTAALSLRQGTNFIFSGFNTPRLGILDPGTYRLVALADGVATSGHDFTGEMHMIFQVPSPSGTTLAIVTVAWGLARRRR